MYALPPITNPLQPPRARSWFPALKFPMKPYLELCRSIDRSLADLEARYPSHRSAAVEERRVQLLQRRKPR